MGMSQGECRLSDRDIQLAADLPLSNIEKQEILSVAQRFLSRYTMRFSLARIHLHLKGEDRGILCRVRFVTERGIYMTRVLAWSSQQAFAEALENVDTQLRKSFDIRSWTV